MSLTGIPLILLSAAVTSATGLALAWLWPRASRLRALTRAPAVLLLEVLIVLTAGLAVNRHEQFYPSWQALSGRTGTITVTRATQAGRLDEELPDGSAVVLWQPPRLREWRLAGPPRVVVPAGYRQRAGDTFPVVLDLTASMPAALAAARRTTDAVTVVARPTAATTAAALLSLPGELRRDIRVSAGGWDVVGSGREAALAAAFVGAAPAGLAACNRPTDQLPPALAAPMRLPS
jgi:lysyl-tRNA synthetase class 2